MVGMKRQGLLALALVLATAGSGQAFFRGLLPWNWGSYPYYSGRSYYSGYSYYGSAPAWCGPAYGASTMPGYAAPWARPVAAQPSEKVGPGVQTKEPPGANPTKAFKAPVITESRSLGGAYASSAGGERCKVGFWNVSGQDITLKVDGEARVLARNRAVTLELARSFVWQIDQREPTSEQVPGDQPFHEVIIRQ